MQEAKITFTLNRLVSVLNSHADAILRARYDMTFSQFLFLVALRPGPLSMTGLGASLDVTTAAVSKRAPWFEERKLIRIHSDPRHGRKQLLSLTSKGQRLVEETAEALDQAFIERFSDFKSSDLAAFHADLDRVLEHLMTIPKVTT